MTSRRIFLESGARHLPRAGRALAVITALVTLGLALAGAQGTTPARHARPGDVKCNLTLLARDGTITAGEALIAQIEVSSQCNEEVRLQTSWTQLEVRDARGELAAATPRPQLTGDYIYGVRRLAPGERWLRFLIVTGLYQFENPGRYTVRVQQLGFPPELPVLWEDAVSVQVLPYNAARLEAACDELFAPIRKHSSFGAIPMGVRTKALYSVRDDVVLPYLDWMAREWGDSYACRAMRRIGTPRAKKLLAALAARKDRVGKAARDASKIPLEITDWDVLAQ